MSKNACFLLETPLRVESLIKPKHILYKQKYQQNGCEGGAVFVETWDITDFLCFYFYVFYLDGVSADGLTVAPTGVPLLQIDSICTDADKNAVVEKDAVALHLRGGVVSRGGTRNLLAAASAQQYNARYQ